MLVIRSCAAAIALMLVAGSAMAAEPSPETPVREAYAVTIRQLAPNAKNVEPPWRQPHRDKLMSKSLAALFARDDLFQDESGDIGHIDADPFLSGQVAR